MANKALKTISMSKYKHISPESKTCKYQMLRSIEIEYVDRKTDCTFSLFVAPTCFNLRFIYSGWTSISLFMCMYALHSCLLNYIAYSYNSYKALHTPSNKKNIYRF